MCPASTSSAKLSVTIAPTTSATKITPVIPSAIPRRVRFVDPCA